IFYNISLLTLGSFIIIRGIAIPNYRPIINNIQQILSNSLSKGPLRFHSFIPYHKIGFTLMPKTLVGKHPGSLWTQKYGIYPRHYWLRFFYENNTLLYFFFKFILQTFKLLKSNSCF